MKNIFRLTVLVLLIAMSCIAVFAQDTTHDKSNDIEIIFEIDSVFTDSQKQNIIKHFTGEDGHTASVKGILCLFGHNLTTERVQYITHRYYASIPRCLQETYDVSTCSRCDYTSSTFVSSRRVPCCS